MNHNERLRNAAATGRLIWCIDLRKRGATDFQGMLTEAAFNGHLEICELALTWDPDLDVEEMLMWATAGNEARTCCLARKKGARDFEAMREEAFHLTHHEALVKLAERWIFERDSLAHLVYAMLVLTTDDYYFIRRPSRQSGSEQALRNRRFLDIGCRLPLELQMVLSQRVAGCVRDIISRNNFEIAVVHLTSAESSPPSTKPKT